MSNYKRNFLLREMISFFLFQFLIFTLSCSQKNYTSSISYNFKSDERKPDYANLNYWAAHPFKSDPSDEIPLDLQSEIQETEADVFFIHPTTYTDRKMPMGWNADINNADLNEKTDKSTILYQASIFNKYCKVYAPRYRQANIKVFFTSDKEQENASLDTAYEDIKAAFIFYLKSYNKGRPIIIASHSQGTLHAGKLLKEFFENKPLQMQFVCAYIIGLPVFAGYFSQIEPCQDSTSTGCFITWRTFEQNYIASYVQSENQKAYVTNPLTWTLDTTFAPATLNKGGILRNFNKVIPGLVNSQVQGNILWVNKPKFFGNIFLTTKNYHIADYNLFYNNIRENVGTRIRAYLEKNPQVE